jgi:hypothetical protein
MIMCGDNPFSEKRSAKYLANTLSKAAYAE